MTNRHQTIENWLDTLTTKQIIALAFVFAPITFPLFFAAFIEGFIGGVIKSIKERQLEKAYLQSVRQQMLDEGFNPDLYLEPFLAQEDD